MENRIQYRGNGEVTEFFYNFVIFAAGDMEVYLDMKLSVPVTRKAGRSFLKKRRRQGYW